jgi:hypothetical protein
MTQYFSAAAVNWPGSGCPASGSAAGRSRRSSGYV